MKLQELFENVWTDAGGWIHAPTGKEIDVENEDAGHHQAVIDHHKEFGVSREQIASQGDPNIVYNTQLFPAGWIRVALLDDTTLIAQGTRTHLNQISNQIVTMLKRAKLVHIIIHDDTGKMVDEIMSSDPVDVLQRLK